MEEQTIKIEEDTYKITLKVNTKNQVTGEVSVKAPTIDEMDERVDKAMQILMSYCQSFED